MKRLSIAILLMGALLPVHVLYAAQNPQNLPPPVVYFTADPTQILHGKSSVLSWSTLYATECRAVGRWSDKRTIAGSEQVRPDETEEYEIRCSGPGGSTTKEVEVFVRVKKSGSPSIIFTAAPRRVEPGRTSRLEWDTPNADVCVASGGTAERWSGTKRTSSSQTIRPEDTAIYKLACSNEFGTTTESLIIIVNNPPPIPRQFTPLAASCITHPEASLPNTAITYAASAYGGNPPYTYSWSGAVTGAGITKTRGFSSLGTKETELVVTDSSGKTAETSCGVEITLNPPPPIVSTQDTDDQRPVITGRTSRPRLGGPARQERITRSERRESSNPVLAAFQRFDRSDSGGGATLATISAVFGGIFKFIGWALLVIFNLLLLGAFIITVFAIQKERRASRRPVRSLQEILEPIVSQKTN